LCQVRVTSDAGKYGLKYMMWVTLALKMRKMNDLQGIEKTENGACENEAGNQRVLA